MYSNFKRERESTFNEYLSRGYIKAQIEEMCFRKITDEELEHIPFMYRKQSRFLCRPFIFLLAEIVLAAGGIIGSVIGMIHNEEDSWLGILLSLILGGSFIAVTLMAYKDRVDRIITSDSLVIAGEVAEMIMLRRAGNGYSRHAVAVHGVQKLIEVRDRPSVYTGTTVLVHRSETGRYHLIPIPQDSADFGIYPQNYSTELESMDPERTYEYSGFEHVSLIGTDITRISDEDYDKLPRKFKVKTPFGKGIFTCIWLLFTTITIVMIPYLIYFYKVHDIRFLPLCAAFILELMIQWILNFTILTKPFKKEEMITLDCVVISKSISSTDNRISLVDPVRKKYSDAIVNNLFINDIPLRVPVRLFICQGMVVHSKVL